MLCPVCKDTQLVMTERKGIEIDYCPNCRGVWLDRGELDKIIDKASEELTATQPAQQASPVHNDRENGNHNSRRDYDHRDRDYRHKKKSFWMELFD